VVVSRHEAEELQRRIHDLVLGLARRDERIAELEKEHDRIDGARHALAVRVSELSDALTSAQDRLFDARAEVPGWCQRIVHAVYVVENGEGNYIAQLEAEELLEGVSRDQLRACGIKVDR
jgi:chromosome segregation ATPase